MKKLKNTKKSAKSKKCGWEITYLKNCYNFDILPCCGMEKLGHEGISSLDFFGGLHSRKYKNKILRFCPFCGKEIVVTKRIKWLT